jgi:uncharacterized protein (DUF924 family)
MSWTDTLLVFWFDELTREQWFKADHALDATIRERFLETYEIESKSAEIEQAIDDPNAALAAIILLDQLPRNMFRNTPRAFEADARARGLASAIVSRGIDQRVTAERRFFFYLPFEHSEDREDQARSVELFTALGDEELLRFARAHYDIVMRFGRFPHRNAILGRASTAGEVAFLQSPGSSF